MSFWKKIYKKIIKTQEQDPQKLAQDKYLRKLKKNLKSIVKLSILDKGTSVLYNYAKRRRLFG